MTHLMRKPRRLTITVSGHVYQQLLDISDRQGRSLSNCAAYILEKQLDCLPVSRPESEQDCLSVRLVDSRRTLQPLPVLSQELNRGLNANPITKAKQPVA